LGDVGVQHVGLVAQLLVDHAVTGVIEVLQVGDRLAAFGELARVDAAGQVVRAVVGVAIGRSRVGRTVIAAGSRRLLLNQIALGVVLVFNLACGRVARGAVVPHVVGYRVHASGVLVGNRKGLAQVGGDGGELACVVVAALGGVAVAVDAAPQPAVRVEHTLVAVPVRQR